MQYILLFIGEDSYLCAHAVEHEVVMQDIFLLLLYFSSMTPLDLMNGYYYIM